MVVCWYRFGEKFVFFLKIAAKYWLELKPAAVAIWEMVFSRCYFPDFFIFSLFCSKFSFGQC